MRPRALLLCALALAGCSGEGSEPAGAHPNLLLISIDTLRADRLGCYGYDRDTSPALDRFAAAGVRFERVVAESSWTIPSHVTLLSGLYPATHGVHRPDVRLGEDVPVLAETLRAHGYRTFAITAGGWMRAEYGFDRGFDAFLERPQELARTLDELERLLRVDDARPFFGFVHTYDVHCPYDPPEELLRAFESDGAPPFVGASGCGKTHFDHMELTPAQERHLSDRYDAGIRWADDALAPFFAFLEGEGLFASTVVAVTSDHGEELGEHGRIGHGATLYREVLDVPLLLRAPGVEPRVVAQPAGLVDVAPTLLGLLGFGSGGMDGRSFAPLLRGGPPPAAPPGRLSELDWNDLRLRAWTTERESLIVDLATGDARYFDLQQDPAQTRAVDAAEAGERERELEAFVESLEAGARAVEPGEDAGDTPQLRKLGY